MGMFSEIATECTIKSIVIEIAKRMDEAAGSRPADVARAAALAEIGRFCLTQFEYSVPPWAEEYAQKFDL